MKIRTVIKIISLIIYCILLFNYPLTTVIIGIIIIWLYNWITDPSTTHESDKYIEGYFKKDGTYVESHWRRKK